MTCAASLLLVCIGAFSITFAAPAPVALADLSAQGVAVTEATVITDQLRTALASTQRFAVVERTEMESVLREQGFQQAGCVSDVCAVEIGQMLGVRRMVVGTLGQAGKYVLLNLRFVDVQSGQIVYSLSEKFRGGINEVVERGIDRVTARIVKEYPADAAAMAAIDTQSAVAATDDIPIGENPASPDPATTTVQAQGAVPQPQDQVTESAQVTPSSAMPEKQAARTDAAVSANRRGGRVALWATVGAVAVGGVVAAIILAGSGDDGDNTPAETGTVDITGDVVER